MRSVLVPIPAVTWGGLHAFAVNLDRGLRRVGWRWVVLVPEEAEEVSDRLRRAGVEVIRLPLSRFRRSVLMTMVALWRMPREFLQIKRLVVENNIDVIQAVGAHHPHGLIISRLTRRPLVWQLHSNILAAWLRPLVGRIVSYFSASVMTNGKGIARSFNLKTKGDNAPIIFYAAMDPSRFKPTIERRLAARRLLGYSEGDVVVGTIGNRVWQKNHEFLIGVATDLMSKHENFRLCILGACNEGYSKKYMVGVTEPAEQLNRIRPGIVKFFEPGEKVSELIHAFDIFVLTSHSEGVPVALFEAMSAAKPVVTVDVGSIREIVSDGETGALVPPDELDIFLNRLEPFIVSENHRKLFGNKGREVILTEFTLDRVVSAHIRAYEKAASL